MLNKKCIAAVMIAMTAVGCGSRITQPPVLETSLVGTVDPNSEKVPYVDPSLPAGDLQAATEEERKAFMKRQQEKMQEQQTQVDDMRRQKFYDDYYRSRYPSGNQ
jgi:hypothetical protein